MIKQQRLLRRTFAFIAVALAPAICHAGLNKTGSWIANSPNGKYVFVMLRSEPYEEGQHFETDRDVTTLPWRELPFDQLSQKYPVSGMYFLGQGAKLAWEYKGEFWIDCPVYVANDGNYLVELGEPFSYEYWTNPNFGCYVTRAGVTSLGNYKEVFPYWWIGRILHRDEDSSFATIAFDAEREQIDGQNAIGQRITIDTRTGSVVSATDSNVTILKALGWALVLASGAGVLSFVARRRRTKKINAA